MMVRKIGRKDLDKCELVCSCGMYIFGNSKAHAAANLKIHKKSKRHKSIMKNKENRSVE